jgi:hypothetical protein
MAGGHADRRKESDVTINEDALNTLVERFAVDFAAAGFCATVVIGDKLGLYKTLAAKGPVTASELAATAGFDERLVEEWLNAQFVSG